MVIKIISGGQCGADQGALYGARDVGVLTGGFAPYSFCTEKGYAPWLETKFKLVDSGVGYKERTALNVKNSDITIWFGNLTGSGYWATRKASMKLGKTFKEARAFSLSDLVSLLGKYKIVNIAGNRESSVPGICKSTRTTIRDALLLNTGYQSELV